MAEADTDTGTCVEAEDIQQRLLQPLQLPRLPRRQAATPLVQMEDQDEEEGEAASAAVKDGLMSMD